MYDSLPHLYELLPHLHDSLPHLHKLLPHLHDSLPHLYELLPHLHDSLPQSTQIPIIAGDTRAEKLIFRLKKSSPSCIKQRFKKLAAPRMCPV